MGDVILLPNAILPAPEKDLRPAREPVVDLSRAATLAEQNDCDAAIVILINKRGDNFTVLSHVDGLRVYEAVSALEITKQKFVKGLS